MCSVKQNLFVPDSYPSVFGKESKWVRINWFRKFENPNIFGSISKCSWTHIRRIGIQTQPERTVQSGSSPENLPDFLFTVCKLSEMMKDWPSFEKKYQKGHQTSREAPQLLLRSDFLYVCVPDFCPRFLNKASTQAKLTPVNCTVVYKQLVVFTLSVQRCSTWF
jgi:hypothetical protein